VKIAREGRSPLLLSHALLALAESNLLAGDVPAALTIATEAQQRFANAGQYESEWRVLVIEARACERNGDKTRAQQLAQQSSNVFQRLEQGWGAESYDSYLTRSDMKEFQRDLKRLMAQG